MSLQNALGECSESKERRKMEVAVNAGIFEREATISLRWSLSKTCLMFR